MITSDEPGLYLEGKYGIRLENLELCVEREITDYGTFLGFDTLTMCPFERDAIIPEELSPKRGPCSMPTTSGCMSWFPPTLPMRKTPGCGKQRRKFNKIVQFGGVFGIARILRLFVPSPA